MDKQSENQHMYDEIAADSSAAALDGAGTFEMRSTAFLIENPEHFGMTSEATPVVGDHYVIAAGGLDDHRTRTLVHDVGAETPDALFEALYAPVFSEEAEAKALIWHNFKLWNQWQEQSLSKYGAVLCQMMLSHRVRSLCQDPGAIEPNWAAVSDEMSGGLRALHQHVHLLADTSGQTEHPLTVSVGAAFVRRVADHHFYISMLSAGEFRFYLLDKDGMAPLWTDASYPLSEDGLSRLESHHVHVERTEPFAVVVLSENVYRSFRLDGADGQRGLVWRDRMRLERVLLHAVSGCDREDQFPDSAFRTFAGYITTGQAGASGALTVVGGSFERFGQICRTRLQQLEETLELLPDGYDPDRRAAQPSLAHTEKEFADTLLNRSHALQNQMFDVVSAHTEAMLKPLVMRLEESYDPLAGDGPLAGTLVEEIFRSYDGENVLDRRQIGLNQEKLNRLLSDHWITLRPLLVAEESEEATGAKIYACCLRMNRSLLSMQRKKRRCMERLLHYLDTQHRSLTADAEDYIVDRAGADSIEARMNGLLDGVSDAVRDVYEEWGRQSDGYRSLLASYMAERERLFRLDVTTGAFAGYRDMFNGTFADEAWDTLAEQAENTLSANYVGLLDVLRALSQHNGQLRSAILERDAMGRTCRELGGRRACQSDALLAILQCCDGWTWRPESASSSMDKSVEAEIEHEEGTDTMPAPNDITNHYHALVRRWHEVQKHLAKQEDAYVRYRDMYTNFVADQ